MQYINLESFPSARKLMCVCVCASYGYVPVCVPVCLCACMRACRQTRIRVHTCTCTHTHTHNYCLLGRGGWPACCLPTCIHMRTLIQSFTSSLIHTPQSESNMSGLQCSTFTDRRVRFGRTALKPNPNAYARTRLRATGAAAEEPVPALNEDGWARCCMIVMRASRLLTSGGC